MKAHIGYGSSGPVVLGGGYYGVYKEVFFLFCLIFKFQPGFTIPTLSVILSSGLRL